MTIITAAQAAKLYSTRRAEGHGYAPDSYDPTDDSVDGAVRWAEGHGAAVILPREHDSIVVLVDDDGALVGIGGDDMGRGAWAVELVDTATREQIEALRDEAGAAGDGAQVELCKRALGEDDGREGADDAMAWARCSLAIAEAQAQR